MNEEILPVKPDYGELQQAYTELYRAYADLQSEYRTVIITIIRALDALGMWPVSSDNTDLSKLARRLPGLIIDAMMPGSPLKDKFAFMKDIIPIAEKYKNIDVKEL
jgi:hypothetical protein